MGWCFCSEANCTPVIAEDRWWIFIRGRWWIWRSISKSSYTSLLRGPIAVPCA
jgi:hypothetical protein